MEGEPFFAMISHLSHTNPLLAFDRVVCQIEKELPMCPFCLM